MSTSQRVVMLCGWAVKAGMVCEWVVGKTVWFPWYHGPYLSALAMGSSHNTVNSRLLVWQQKMHESQRCCGKLRNWQLMTSGRSSQVLATSNFREHCLSFFVVTQSTYSTTGACTQVSIQWCVQVRVTRGLVALTLQRHTATCVATLPW